MNVLKRMRTDTIATCLLLIGLSLAAISASCSATTGDSRHPDAASERDDAAAPAIDDSGTDGGLPSHALVLTLDPSIDQPDDDVKATTISTAILLDGAGGIVATATIVESAAVFDLTGSSPGDYFVEINGDALDLVPTRIDDPTRTTLQRVGQKLKASYISAEDKPAYRINAYSDGQVVTFFTGAPIGDQHPYLLYAFGTSRLEIRVLGSTRQLSAFPLARCAGHTDVSVDGWLLNTPNEEHHGDSYNATDGGDPCFACHGDGWRRQVSYDDITPSRGWCFKCHRGPNGSSAGFVDPTK